MIGNAEDEAEEEFIIESDRTFTINIAVTDNDWERPLDEDESDVGGGDGPDDDEGKDGDGRGGFAGEGEVAKRKVRHASQMDAHIYTHTIHIYIHTYFLTHVNVHTSIGRLEEKGITRAKLFCGRER